MPLKAPVVAGKPSSAYADAVIRWIETGAGLALSGQVGGLVTAPIAKAPLYEAGFGFPGHTEFLAELTRGAAYAGPRGPVMMLAAADLRTVLVTIHLSLRDAAAGAMVSISSRPSVPLSPAWGLSAARARRGRATPKSSRSAWAVVRAVAAIASAVTPAAASRRDRWMVTSTVRRSAAASIITGPRGPA